MATAAIAHKTIALTVEALQSNWGVLAYTETPATSHDLLLPFIWASSDETTDDHKDETNKFKVAGPESSTPGPWLSESIIDCLLSPEREELTDAEEGRYERLRLAQESFIGIRHHGLHTIPDEFGNTFNTARDELGLAVDKERYSWQPELSGALPAEWRALASLYYLEEKTRVECGEELGITQGALNKQLTRVREYIAAKKAAK